jgi:DNA-binding transcriptional regulator YiaG
LKNQYLLDGYKLIETPYGEALVVEDMEELHRSIAWNLVETKPFLTGPEFRFIRKTLGLTQATIAEITGYDEQTARRWETLGRVPKWADHAIRYIYRDYENGEEPIRGAVENLKRLEQAAYEDVKFKWSFRRKGPKSVSEWQVARSKSKAA